MYKDRVIYGDMVIYEDTVMPRRYGDTEDVVIDEDLVIW